MSDKTTEANIDRHQARIAELKARTKPEAPALEPQAFVPTRTCTYQEHAKRIQTMLAEGLHDGKRWKLEAHERYAELQATPFVPATAAPSQPAREWAISGAKEWRIEWGWAGDQKVPFLKCDGRDGIQLDLDSAAYIKWLMDAAQQSAAKDALYREQLRLKDEYIALFRAAERERDSLREERDRARFERDDIAAKSAAELAALKAGKESQ